MAKPPPFRVTWELADGPVTIAVRPDEFLLAAARAAVAPCPHCWVGVCLAHRAEAQRPGPGGLQLGRLADTEELSRPSGSACR